ncbi:MAG TPA: ATP-binding protein [Candidatus Acidoferrales bacterium]|nr:ATP-binding protein [Candidatus Acidoferrales bacterium]
MSPIQPSESTVQILPANMTSLPMSVGMPEPGRIPGRTNIGELGSEDEQFLLRAFRSFSAAAGSLERSYATLQGEVIRLRRELETTNNSLAESLEENRSMRLHLDHILENLPCGILVVVADGTITRANSEAHRLLASEIVGAGIGSIEDLSRTVQELLSSAREESTEPEVSTGNERSPQRWLAARHAPIGNSASVFILRDVTERRRLEEDQDRFRREQALAEMSAVLAHEIRNPLGSLELFAGLLADASLSPECQKWVEHLQAGLRTLSATVNNVLQFHSSPALDLAPVDLGSLLDWSRDFLMPLARQSQVTLGLQNRLHGVTLLANRHGLEQVLLNLVLNSLRAMPGGGWVEIAGRKSHPEGSITLDVTDTGPGISPEHLPHIFDPGFTSRSGSPGLGLAVCRKIVEQHGGTIHAQSRPGWGAKFTLAFSLASPCSSGAAK